MLTEKEEKEKTALSKQKEQLAEEKKNFYDWQVGNGSGYRVIIDEKEWKTGNKKLRKVEKLWD